MRTKADHGLSLLQGALTLPLPRGWRVLASGTDWAEIDSGVPSAVIALRVERFEDPDAIRRRDFSAYITPGEGNPQPGLTWDPAERYAFLARPDHRQMGPHFLVVDAVPFGPWIYRMEYALPLRQMPAGDDAGGLVQVDPLPRLLNDVLRHQLFDPPRSEAAAERLTGRETELRTDCFALTLPQHWIVDPETDADGRIRYAIEDERDPDGATLWIETMRLTLPPGVSPPSLRELARGLYQRWTGAGGKAAPDDPAPEQRPKGGPTLCDWPDGEALLKARTSYLDATEGPATAHRIDDEYGLRLRTAGGGCDLVHFHLCYGQERRFDAPFQATASRLWLHFLAGRFLDSA